MVATLNRRMTRKEVDLLAAILAASATAPRPEQAEAQAAAIMAGMGQPLCPGTKGYGRPPSC